MAYNPTEWKSGDVISAEKLNKLEGAVANPTFLEKVQTVPAISGDYTVMSTPLGDNHSELACTIENWCVLQRNGVCLGGAFTVTVTYVDGEGETNVDVAEIETHTNFDGNTRLSVLNWFEGTTLYVNQGAAGTLGVIAAPVNNNGYTGTNLIVVPRRPQQDSVAHIEITPVDLFGVTQSFLDALRISND